MTLPPALTQAEAFARIRLLRSPNIGPVSFMQLIRRFGSAAASLEALPDLAARGGGRYAIAPAARIEEETARIRSFGARYLFFDSPDYPAALSALESPPPILTMRGDGTLLARPSVAMVGARNASAGAIKLAREFSASLAARGYAVISGLARGIDSAAHQGALAAMGEGGGTVGVIASGIDVVYPPENAGLQEDVAMRGLLIAEMPPGTQPLARHFPWRNRIIAGLASGTVVVEAAPRSGSLITARLAGEAGREVMAVPGSPLDSRSLGCNKLIRDGAVLVQSADDIAELLERFDGTPRSTFQEQVMPDYEPDVPPADIAGMLGAAPVSIDEIIRQSGALPSAVQFALLELELAGRLQRHAGGRVSIITA